MNTYMKTNVLCLGLLCALSLTACSEDAGVSQNYGTTEEKNAFWNEASNLTAWRVMDGSGIELDASKKTLAGRVSLAKAGDDGLGRAGMVFNASSEDGSPVDLSEGSGGLCIAYGSDFNVEVRLDDGDYASASVDKDLPYASFAVKGDGKESHCVSWDDFKKKNSDLKGDSFAKKVRSVQIVFVGKSGASGEFDIQRLSSYTRWAMWWSKTHGNRVDTGFDEGDEGTSGRLTFFGNLSEEQAEYTDDGLVGRVVFDDSSSNPDVGVQFLVAGKTTENGAEVIHSADVSTRWKGICLEYESQMDIEMALVSANEGNALTLIFAKNDDMTDKSVNDSDGEKRKDHTETSCYSFDDVPNSDDVLQHLTTIRLKFVKDNNSGTNFKIRRISYLLPEDKAVRDVGGYRKVNPSESSSYKSGKSFLWNGAVDGDHVNLGIANATSGGNWFNSIVANDYNSVHFPDDVVADAQGNVIPSLVSKYHKLTAYVKGVTSIGFNTVSSNQEPADISAWDGFCIHYSTYNTIRIAIVTDASANKFWYADVDYSNDMVWGKVSWDAFKNVDEESNETIEDVLGKVTSIQLFFYEGENVVDKFGSYDQCGN